MKKDGRKNNGGHSNGGKRRIDPKDKKLLIPIYLSENQFNAPGWEYIVCRQFEEKFEKKLNPTN